MEKGFLVNRCAANKSNESRRAKKVNEEVEYAEPVKGFIFLDVLFTVEIHLSKNPPACCRICGGRLELQNNDKNRMGFSISILSLVQIVILNVISVVTCSPSAKSTRNQSLKKLIFEL